MMHKIQKMLLLIIFIILIYTNSIGNYFFVLNKNWKIRLPYTKITHEKRSEANFLGDGIKYAILKYETKPKKIDWNSEKNPLLEAEVQKILEKIGPEEKNILNFNDSYLHYTQTEKDGSKLYLIYMTTQKELYVIEFFV